MLWIQKAGSSPMTLAACIFFALPIIVYFRIPRDHQFASKLAAITRPTSPSSLPVQANSSLVDENPDFLFDNALEGGPRIRQVSMLFGGGEKGEDAMYERAMKTHLQHGERWGYPSHILRQDLVGKGDWKVLVNSHRRDWITDLEEVDIFRSLASCCTFNRSLSRKCLDPMASAPSGLCTWIS